MSLKCRYFNMLGGLYLQRLIISYRYEKRWLPLVSQLLKANDVASVPEKNIKTEKGRFYYHPTSF